MVKTSIHDELEQLVKWDTTACFALMIKEAKSTTQMISLPKVLSLLKANFGLHKQSKQVDFSSNLEKELFYSIFDWYNPLYLKLMLFNLYSLQIKKHVLVNKTLLSKQEKVRWPLT